MSLNLVAAANLHNLSLNTYPGRGIVMGLGEKGDIIYQICWTMGRSEGSRNRRYEEDKGGRLYTVVANPDLEKGDPKTTLYNAMVESRHVYVVGNGSQTDVVHRTSAFLNTELMEWKYEPDVIHTPRITGKVAMGTYEFLVLRKSSPSSDECDHLYYKYCDMEPGTGRCVTTYLRDGGTPPHWEGEPYPVPLRGDAGAILKTFWGTLNEQNRVSCAVKVIPLNRNPSWIEYVNKY